MKEFRCFKSCNQNFAGTCRIASGLKNVMNTFPEKDLLVTREHFLDYAGNFQCPRSNTLKEYLEKLQPESPHS